MEKVKLFKKLPQNLIQCLACSWYCKIPPNRAGICRMRANKNGNLHLLTGNKNTGLAVDPIEKKPFFHFLPGSLAMSFGTLGCNFACAFCQNAWASQSPKQFASNPNEIEEIESLINRLSVKAEPKEIVTAALKLNCQSIAYTYNEPAVFVEYAYETMTLAKKNGLKNVFVSNGYESKETFHLIKDCLDGINIDLKSSKEKFYRKICTARLKPVLENIKKFFQAGIWLEITTLVIPGKNDSKKELIEIANFIAEISPDIPWHLSAFHPDYKMKDFPRTKAEKLIEAYQIGKKAGLNYVYLGNVSGIDEKYFSTYCPQCRELIIERDAYRLSGIVGLKNNQCLSCQKKIAGVFQ